MTEQYPTATPWQGIHHVALASPDLDITLHFYRDRLGMQLIRLLPADGERGRHAFVSPGGEGLGLHIFEYPNLQFPSAWEHIATLQWEPLPGAFQHIAFALPDEAAALHLRGSLEADGVPMTPINTIGPLQNFLFPDPHGTVLEAAWPRIE